MKKYPVRGALEVLKSSLKNSSCFCRKSLVENNTTATLEMACNQHEFILKKSSRANEKSALSYDRTHLHLLSTCTRALADRNNLSSTTRKITVHHDHRESRTSKFRIPICPLSETFSWKHSSPSSPTDQINSNQYRNSKHLPVTPGNEIFKVRVSSVTTTTRTYKYIA